MKVVSKKGRNYASSGYLGRNRKGCGEFLSVVKK